MSIRRLKALYSDFTPQKQSNPTSYSSNIEWWRQTLETIVSRGFRSQSDKIVLRATGPSLAEEFRMDGVGKPLGLPTVIAELHSTKAYYVLSEFMKSPCSIYDNGSLPYRVASYVVGKPLWWALQQLNIVDPEGGLSCRGSDVERWNKVKGDYVIIDILERAANNIVRRQRGKSGVSLADSLYSFETFRQHFANNALENVVLSDLDLRVLIKYLERDKRVLTVHKEVIKFLDPDTESAEVTPVDEGVLELKIAVDKLQAQVDDIQVKIDDRTTQASLALRQKRKEIAMTHLRARRQYEDLLRKRLGSLDTLQATLIRVEASAGDIEIMKSYESSAATLRAILAHPSLQREKIDETMDAMASANSDAREIDESIRVGIDMAQAEVDIDEADLEEELQALVKEAEVDKSAQAKAEKEREEDASSQATEVKLAAAVMKVPAVTPVGEPTDVPQRQEGEKLGA